MRDSLENLLLIYPEHAREEDVLNTLWKTCFYKPIEEFRSKVRRSKKALEEANSKNLDYAQLVHTFQQFLSDGIIFYSNLLRKVGVYSSKRQVEPDNLAKYQCYLYLGDLERYKQLHTLNIGEEPNFSQAKEYYYSALHLLPDHGNPHNQLGVLSTYSKAFCLAVYYYCRSLHACKPFPTSRDNLALLYANNKKDVISPANIPRNKPLHVKHRVPVLQEMQHNFVRMHGIIFTHHEDIHEMGKLYTSLVDDLGLLLRSCAIGPDLLIKLFVVNIFSLNHVKQLNEKEVSSRLKSELESISLAISFGMAACVCANANLGKDKGKLLGSIGVFADWVMNAGKNVLLHYVCQCGSNIYVYNIGRSFL